MKIFAWIFIIGIFLYLAYSAGKLLQLIRKEVTLAKIKKFFSKESLKKRSKKDVEFISMIILGLYVVAPFGILKSAIDSVDINVFLGVVLLLALYAMAGYLLLVSPKMLFCTFLLIWVIALFYAFISMEVWQFILSLCLFISTTATLLHDYIKSNKDKEE